MNPIDYDRVNALYVLALQCEAAEVTDIQKRAIEQLKEYSLQGNPAADAALKRLKHLPDIHPHLRVVLAV
ncbi:MAG: hypothetical protein WCH85_01075 [Methanomicrobiales archaeon]